ncbi:MAG: FAD-dependent oxidoreductase, partial [Bacteroidetes bacterium]|nr:FAD-dependent oxidoreductase [Bacteroidota bacterium]
IFFGKKSDSGIIISKVGLSKLFVENAVDLLKLHKGKIFYNSKIEILKINKNKVKEVILDDGKILKTKAIISTIPYFAIEKSPFKNYYPKINYDNKFESSSIITIHLWFDKIWFNENFVALVDSPIQWIFNHNKIKDNYSSDRQYISLVISGANKLINKTKIEILIIATEELKKYYPKVVDSKLIESTIIKEKRATFKPKIGIQKYRPKTETKLKNLFLAGDWTSTDLPATIEGAIKSGYGAANLVEENLLKI